MNDLDDIKAPLYDLELEDAVLGAIMLESDCLFENINSLHENIFYKPVHKVIFRAIKILFEQRITVDILTVYNKLKEINQAEKISAHYLSQLTNKVASSANIEYHIKILTQLFLKRQIGEICGETYDRVKNFSTDVIEELDNLELQISQLNEFIVGKDYDIDMDNEIEKRFIFNLQKRNSQITGVHTGNDIINKITKGWQKKDLIILGGRSSMGKTAKAIDVALHATKHGKKPIVFSLEMSREQLIDRILCNLSEVGSDTVKEQSWTEVQIKQYQDAKTGLQRSGLYIVDRPKVAPKYVRTVSRLRKMKFGCDLIVIDYLQLMEPNKKMRSREEEIASISRELKSIAKELDVPIIALSQLNRDVEKRSDKRPVLSDLRESGSIEHDADLVMFVYRPSYYYDKKNDPDYKTEVNMSDEEYSMLTEIIIAKHRNGSLGRTKEYFHNDKSKFTKEFKQDKLPF